MNVRHVRRWRRCAGPVERAWMHSTGAITVLLVVYQIAGGHS